jgi:hypothetical protein
MENIETRLQQWGATDRGRRFLSAVYGAIIAVALISVAAELLATACL